MATEAKRTFRCAIYTRKSSEEGLEQSFNSLDAQREACLSYIQSQKHEGWKALPTYYDDGGYSGGTLIRPAMTKLLEDISTGKVDLVVVYKVDRLTRSLSDFAKIVEALDAKGVSFVSVTQAFNTSTSMGRLTLNVLLSFAQFEREVTGERIRDKIAASKRKGMWMGGAIPYGYDLKDRKLHVNAEEAELVRRIFTGYLELKNVRLLKAVLDSEGILTKIRTSRHGNTTGGRPWFRGALYGLLRNPIYLGEIRHKGLVFPGDHEAILRREVWEEVQRTLDGNAARRERGEVASTPSLLVGRVVDDQGNPMVPSHTQRRSRRYRYYAATPLSRSREGVARSVLRIPAHDLEEGVWGSLRAFLSSPIQLLGALGEVGSRQNQVIQAAARAVQAWDVWTMPMRRGWLKDLLHQVVVSPGKLVLLLNRRALHAILGLSVDGSEGKGSGSLVTLETEAKLKRGGRGLRFVLPGPDGSWSGAQLDKPLLRALARGRLWYDQLLSGQAKSREEIGRANCVTGQHVTRHLRLAWLAPDIVEAILEGRQPRDLTVQRLFRGIPLDWAEQRRALGFEPRSKTA